MIEVVGVLVALMIVAAILVVEAPNLLLSVVSVGAVGFLGAIAFLFLGAPDVAIVQIGIEAITLVILIRATIGRDVVPARRRAGLVGVVAAVTLLAALALFGMRAFSEFPALGQSVMQRVAEAPSNTYLHQSLVSTGAPNVVTAVLLDFRAYDTLGEATVLFCAVLGALSILRRKARVGHPKPPSDKAEVRTR
jgi:multisubunit Na+/H+ antiporter MnhB subunit